MEHSQLPILNIYRALLHTLGKHSTWWSNKASSESTRWYFIFLIGPSMAWYNQHSIYKFQSPRDRLSFAWLSRYRIFTTNVNPILSTSFSTTNKHPHTAISNWHPVIFPTQPHVLIYFWRIPGLFYLHQVVFPRVYLRNSRCRLLLQIASSF